MPELNPIVAREVFDDVHGDASQPRINAGISAKLRPAPARFPEAILGKIFRHFLIAHPSQHEMKDA
jgi:hypothetical protein